MKIAIITLSLILCISSCKKKHKNTEKGATTASSLEIEKKEFQAIIDSSNVKGAILIYDLKQGTYYSNNFDWANKGNLPASTFKIPNSIIGLETGAIKSDSTIFKWDGKQKWSKSWEQDLVLKKAFQFSCVPCYQEVARKIGAKKMNYYVKKLDYGNLNIDSLNIDTFWLEGKSRISQMQQIDFLKRLYNLKLPISKRTEYIIRDIMLIEKTDQYKLSGKTGLSINNEHYNGWFVGFIELKNNAYFFATNLEPNKDFELNTFIKKRMNLTLIALKKLNIFK